MVLDEFYSKDVASKCVINARSALPWSCKRTVLTQEILRIFLNCSRELPWETVVSHVNHMYRPRDWRQLERAKERWGKRGTWYRKGGFDTVIFVPATPGSQLKNRYMREIKEAGLKIKVVSCNPEESVTKVRPIQREAM